MTVKLCPLMLLANHQDPSTLSQRCSCIETDCAWWVKTKAKWDCSVNLIPAFLEGIGKVVLLTRYPRGVTRETKEALLSQSH